MTMGIKFPKEPYHIINFCFAGIILLIFAYSGIFSAQKNNHPIKSACETIIGKPCKSTGLSRSFSEIVRFRFESAKNYNKHGLKIFGFFFVQFFLRLFISFLVSKKPKLIKPVIIVDAAFSIMLYIYCFWGLIA